MIGGWWRRMLTISRQITGVLSINKRNLEYVYTYNRRRDYPVADNKLLTKRILQQHGIPVPDTLASFGYFYELTKLEHTLAPFNEFVIKPARGSAGGGIIVITGRDADGWIGTNNRRYSLEQIKRHISDIIFGIHSFGLRDEALIEQRVQQHPEVERLCAGGLADVRIITLLQQPVIAMLRVPTRASGGRANLHQGALGIAIDLDSGKTINATLNGRDISIHPDSGIALLGFTLPYWDQLIATAGKAAGAVPLRYLGVDVTVSKQGPVVLEINVRPGLEIQNVNNLGMRHLLQTVENSA